MAATSFHSTSFHLLTCLAITFLIKLACAAPASTPYVSTHEELGSGTSIIKRSVKNPEEIAKMLALKAKQLNEEFCENSLSVSSMERTLKKELKLPEILTSHGCLHKGFNAEKCLHKIHGDLVKFQPYLELLKEPLTETNRPAVESMRLQASLLSETVKEMEKNPDKETEDNMTEIENLPKGAWAKKVTACVILQSFRDYMEKTTRAVRTIVSRRT